VSAAARFADLGESRYSIDPGVRSHYDDLAAALRKRNAIPAGILNLWPAAARPRRGFLRRSEWDPLATYDQNQHRYFYSLIFAVQAFAADSNDLRIVCVSSQMQSVPGDVEVHPEKAVLLGPCKVIPREYPHVRCTSIDLDSMTPGSERQLAERVLREMQGDSPESEVVLRGKHRWIRRFDPVRLPPAGDRK
jgi:hypothetical protein